MEGRRLERLQFLARRARGGKAPPSGCVVRRVRRHGKQVLVELDRGVLLVKLGMTGSLLVDHPRGPYTRAVLRLDGLTVNFDDVRQFGSIAWLAQPPEKGPDPLEIPFEEFAARLRGRNSQIKRLLLDQSFLRGIGNIYADEALFRAGVHPLKVSRRIGPARVRRLWDSIRAVLSQAIERRGSSVSDYVDADGEEGDFQRFHQVYQRTGEPCLVCGARIRRILVAQRGTHFCPKCQRG